MPVIALVITPANDHFGSWLGENSVDANGDVIFESE